MDKHKTECQIPWQKFLYDISLEINREKAEVIACAAQFELAQSLTNFIPTSHPSLTSLNETESGANRGRVIHTLRFQVNNCRSVSILSSSVIENIDRGFCHPCILIKAVSVDRRDNEFTSLHLVHLTESGLQLKGQFQVEQSVLEGNYTPHFDILNESLISFVLCSKIHFIRFKDPRKAAQMCTCNVIAILTSPSKKIPHSSLKILGFRPIHRIHRNHDGETSTFCDVLLLLTVESPKSVAGQDPLNPWELPSPNKTVAVLITLLQDHSYRTDIIDGTDFLPNIYGSLVTQLQILSARKHPKTDTDQPRDGAERGVKTHMESTVLVSTSSGQLLYFKNGDLKRCMAIESGEGLKMVQFENCIGASYFLLQNDENIDVIDAQSFEVRDRFSGMSRVHVGDFVGSGGDQVLMVSKQEALTSPQNWTKFILTDFHSCNIRSSQTESTSEEGTTNGSIQAAVQALEGRLQASVTYVCGVEREFENKLRLVEQSVAMLKQLALDREPVCTSQPGLMPLLGEENTKGAKRVDKSLDRARDTVCASDVWHKIFSDFWVLSIVLLNTSKRCLESLRLSLIPHHSKQPIESTTSFTPPHPHTSHHTTPSAADEPTPKLRRLDSHRQRRQHPLVSNWSLEPSGSVQCVIKAQIPGFTSGDVRTVTVMASWVETGSDGGKTTRGTEIGGMESRGGGDGVYGRGGGDGVYGRGSVCCGAVARVELTARDVVSGTLHVQPGASMSADAILVLDVTQRCYPLTIRCSYSSLGNLSHTLQGALQFQWLEASHSWMCLQGGCLNHVRVEVLPQLDINVHVRDESQLFLLVHALYDVLPDDVIILPRHSIDVTTLTTSLLSDITAETDFIRDNSQALLVKTEKAPNTEAENSDCRQDKISAIRKDFAQKKQHVLGGGDARIDDDKLKQFQTSLHRLEKRTNDNMETLSRRIWGINVS